MTLKPLRDRILKDGRCYEGGILKVDRFINHQMDPYLMKQVAIELIRRFADAQEEKTFNDGRYVRLDCHLVHQASRLHDGHQQGIPHG